jgi:hypothetical protein
MMSCLAYAVYAQQSAVCKARDRFLHKHLNDARHFGRRQADVTLASAVSSVCMSATSLTVQFALHGMLPLVLEAC